MAYPDLTPGQVYHQADAAHGREAARALVTACRQWLAEHERILMP